MSENILALGSVVTLKNGDGTKLMIISRGVIAEVGDKEVYYDYGAVLIPYGMVDVRKTYFFNRENIEEVIFKGYVDESEKQFAEKYDYFEAEVNMEKGKI